MKVLTLQPSSQCLLSNGPFFKPQREMMGYKRAIKFESGAWGGRPKASSLWRMKEQSDLSASPCNLKWWRLPVYLFKGSWPMAWGRCHVLFPGLWGELAQGCLNFPGVGTPSRSMAECAGGSVAFFLNYWVVVFFLNGHIGIGHCYIFRTLWAVK